MKAVSWWNAGGRLVLPASASELEAPGSLLDLLTVRLDRLGAAKETAQTAAVIGRDFRLDALSHMSGNAQDQIQVHLEELVGGDMVSEIEGGDGSRCQFRHALYQKVAYESLLRRHRRALHGAYLAWLDANPVAKNALLREQLAFHSELAGQDEAAVAFWIEAGENATSASASQEAVRHFESGLRVLRRQPRTQENLVIALKLYALLGGALMMSKGPGAPETRAAYDRALKLCQTLPQTQWHFPVYWGWWRISENFNVMLGRAERLVQVAEDMNDPEFSLQAHHCLWVNAYMVGDHEKVLEEATVGLKLYEEGNFSQSGSLYGGHDPKICGLGEKALSFWLMGKADRAAETLKLCLDWADELGHLGSHLHALDIALMLYHFRYDLAAVGRIAARLRDISERNELDDYRAKADIFEGWRLIEVGERMRGSELLEEGLADMRVVGSREDFPVYFCMLAESHLRQGKTELASALLREGGIILAEEGADYWAPEIHRLTAEALAATKEPDLSEVDRHLERALDIARSQGALALELRAATSKARLIGARGQVASAHDTLFKVMDRFEEGLDSHDFRQAAALLASLSVGGDPDQHVLV